MDSAIEPPAPPPASPAVETTPSEGCLAFAGHGDDRIGIAHRSMLATVAACCYVASDIMASVAARETVVNYGSPQEDAITLMDVAERTLSAARLLAMTHACKISGAPIFAPRRAVGQ